MPNKANYKTLSSDYDNIITLNQEKENTRY